jgi:hypothetical protein
LIARAIRRVCGKVIKDYVGQGLEEGRFVEELEERIACSAVGTARILNSTEIGPPQIESAWLCLPLWGEALSQSHFGSLGAG